MIVADRVQQGTTTVGTGTITLDVSAPTDSRAFQDVFQSGDVVGYLIYDGTSFEVGEGTLTTGTPWTLSRDTVHSSSNGGSLVNWGAGTKSVACVVPAALFNNLATRGSNTFTGDQTLAGHKVIAPKLQASTEVQAGPAIAGGTLTLDLATANFFDVALTANVTTLTISNPAPSGTVHGFVLAFTADGTARTVTWGAAVKWPGGTAPTLTSTNGKRDHFVFYTTDGGTTWYAFVGGKNS